MEDQPREQIRPESRGWQKVRGEFIEAQAGQCAICRRHFGRTRPANLDHCHITGFVRGALCSSCNLRLGWLEKYRASIEDYLAAAGEFMAYRHNRLVQVLPSITDEIATEIAAQQPGKRLSKDERKRERIRHYHLNKEARKAKKAVTANAVIGSAVAHAGQETAPLAAPSVSLCDGNAA